MHIFDKTIENIYKKPAAVPHPFKIREMTIGDLHANLIKLLYGLLRHQIISMIDEDFYHLVELNKIKPQAWSPAFITEFKQAVRRFKVVNKGVLVRLLGDDVADRWPVFDLAMLWFFEEFTNQDGLLQIHLSNHGYEFITYMEAKINHPELPLQQFSPDYTFTMFNQHKNIFTASLANMHYALFKNLITLDEVKSLYQTIYRPLLRVMTYSQCPETYEVHFFSHAEVGLETIDALGACFDVDCRKKTSDHLMSVLDQHNFLFQQRYAFSNQIIKQCGFDVTKTNAPLSKLTAFAHLVWRRPNLSMPMTTPGQLPSEDVHTGGKQVTTRWFHGHHGCSQNTPYSCTLESLSGQYSYDYKLKDQFMLEREYIDLVSEHLPREMLIYEYDVIPKVRALLSTLPEVFKSFVDTQFEQLWLLTFRFVIKSAQLQQHDMTNFLNERWTLVHCITILLPNLTIKERQSQEREIINHLQLPLNPIFKRYEQWVAKSEVSQVALSPSEPPTELSTLSKPGLF